MNSIKSLLIFCAIIVLTGCAGFDQVAYEQKVVEQPGQITKTNISYITNVVNIASATNAATGEITPPKIETKVTPVVTFEYSPPILTTNLVNRPIVDSAINTVGALPIPFAGTIAIGLGWLYSAYAAWRNKKTSVALISGIEAARKVLLETEEGKNLDDAIKAKLIEHQQAAGVLEQVTSLVQRYTTPTKS